MSGNISKMAFDFALTPQGWVLIEGNWRQFLSEFVFKEGLKNKFIEYANGIFNGAHSIILHRHWI